MNEPLDDRLRDALHADARRARPDPAAWARVTERLSADPAGRSRPALLATAAVVVLLVSSAAAAFFLTRDGSDEQSVVVETPTTTTDAIPTTTTSSPTTTTEADDEPSDIDVVVDPIGMGPTPPTRDEPPAEMVAVLPDGRLVMVDSASGDILEELADGGDLRDTPQEGGPSGIWQVALSADGEEVWYSRCCEPAAGITLRHPFNPDQTDMTGMLQADAPTFTMTSEWVVGASYIVPMRNTRTGEHRWWSTEGIDGFTNAVLSPDGQRLVAERWPERESTTGAVVGRRPMLVARTGAVHPTQQGTIVDDDPVELPSDRWTLPTFRRDGLLLVAEEGDDGDWRQALVDIETLEVTDPDVAYDQTPVMQRYDGTGEWLLVLLTDVPERFPLEGRLVWFGPDGQTGRVPGTYTSAAW